MPTPYRPIEERFWEKVNKGDGCWEWTAARRGRETCNYGVFKARGKTHQAHRFSYEIANGAIPTGMKVLHRCDNAICVNPGHLFLGTQADNMQDMSAKGRCNNLAERPWRRKFTHEIAEQIRRDRMEHGYSHRYFAEKYGISDITVSKIIHRKTWADK